MCVCENFCIRNGLGNVRETCSLGWTLETENKNGCDIYTLRLPLEMRIKLAEGKVENQVFNWKKSEERLNKNE